MQRYALVFALTMLALAASGCVERTPDGIPLALVSPSAIPIPTPTKHVPTQAAPTAVPTPICTERIGSVRTSQYRAVAVAQNVPFSVYLPPCYDATDEFYPTLYLLHGYPYDQGHWQELGAIEAANRAIEGEKWPPFIMVMPLQPEPLFRGSDGGPGSYESEFIEGLVPFIEENYRSSPADRALAGISRGGVWALELALRNPLYFDAVAALSPALAVNSARPPYDPFEIAATMDQIPLEILLMAGDSDWAAVETERLSMILSERGVEHMLQITAGDHSNQTWQGAMDDALGFLALGSVR